MQNMGRGVALPYSEAAQQVEHLEKGLSATAQKECTNTHAVLE